MLEEKKWSNYCRFFKNKFLNKFYLYFKPSLDELAEWKSANNIIDDLMESKEQDNTGERGQRLASKIASGRIKNSSASSKNIFHFF